jgi:hypothetical protein
LQLLLGFLEGLLINNRWHFYPNPFFRRPPH